MKLPGIATILLLLCAAAPVEYLQVPPSSLSVTPDEYVGVPVKFKCRFIKIDSTWLGDREVFRSPEKYVGFVVEAEDRIFAQLFYPLAEEDFLRRFESGDRLIVYGTVFSGKYNFPWIDVDTISEGWVVGEEPEAMREKRVEVAKNYEEFLQARRRILQELKLDDVRDIFQKQEALIGLLIEKGIFSREEFDQALSRQKVKPTPPPPWDVFLKEKE